MQHGSTLTQQTGGHGSQHGVQQGVQQGSISTQHSPRRAARRAWPRRMVFTVHCVTPQSSTQVQAYCLARAWALLAVPTAPTPNNSPAAANPKVIERIIVRPPRISLRDESVLVRQTFESCKLRSARRGSRKTEQTAGNLMVLQIAGATNTVSAERVGTPQDCAASCFATAQKKTAEPPGAPQRTPRNWCAQRQFAAVHVAAHYGSFCDSSSSI